MENTYPVRTKKVFINGDEYELCELPVSYLIGIEEGKNNSKIENCVKGSNIPLEVINSLTLSQLNGVYGDIMILSYGDDWEKRAKEGEPSKKN